MAFISSGYPFSISQNARNFPCRTFKNVDFSPDLIFGLPRRWDYTGKPELRPESFFDCDGLSLLLVRKLNCPMTHVLLYTFQTSFFQIQNQHFSQTIENKQFLNRIRSYQFEV